MVDQPEFRGVLTVREVADALRCSRSNIYEQVRTGDIPSLRVGRTVRIPARWVDDVIAAALATAPDPTSYARAYLPSGLQGGE